MEYTVQKLAALAGVSPCTLRYYDEIGLLSPERLNSSGYRIYGEKEEGKATMSNQEKFEGFKKNLVEGNEKKYGQEVREKYGDDTVDKSNAKMMNLTEEEYQRMQEIGEEINRTLEEAVRNNEYPEDSIGEKVALLHKEWLGFTWTFYSPQAHRGLVQMYVADERFKQYYDKNVEGCAQFLKAAVEYHI